MLGLSVGHWVIVLLVVMVLFGTSRLRNVGSDLGAAIRSFKTGLGDDGVDAIEKTKKPADQA